MARADRRRLRRRHLPGRHIPLPAVTMQNNEPPDLWAIATERQRASPHPKNQSREHVLGFCVRSLDPCPLRARNVATPRRTTHKPPPLPSRGPSPPPDANGRDVRPPGPQILKGVPSPRGFGVIFRDTQWGCDQGGLEETPKQLSRLLAIS